MLFGGDHERVGLRQATAKLLRMGLQLLQLIFGLDTRHARFTHLLELGHEPVSLSRPQSQLSQTVLSVLRQQFDHIEARRAGEASGKRRLRGDCA